MLLRLWHTTITRLRPGVKTQRGTETPDWENVDRLDINECLVQPSTTSLSQDGRVQGVIDGLTACCPVDADILPGDRIEYYGDVYTIVGDPMLWRDVGKLEHMQLNLQRWSG